ncbi:MAG: hypothetical protein M1837_002058 [Sclerophora amabilis]|nr:MAG: hypothetical protein M1837_002058 [Sclerophora amabilis]
MQATQEHPHPKARNYGKYQNEIYFKGMIQGQPPSMTTDSRLLEEQAKKHLGVRSFNYVAGGAGERATMDANRLAFRQWKMIPRMLRSTTHRDTSVSLFGTKYDSPVLVAPVGVQSIFHADKETGVAEMASEIGVPYILSTAASSTIEEVAAASDKSHKNSENSGVNDSTAKRWYQLYWPHDDEITVSLLQRAKEAHYSVLVVTLDTWALAWRPADLDNAYVPFVLGTGNQIGFSDPVFRRKFSDANDGKQVEDDIVAASVMWESIVFSGRAHTWEQLKLLKDNWDGPIVLKGIQHVEDAKMAVEHGVQGIIVSNHGGRQLDGAIGSLSVLPEISAAVGSQLTVLFDSGIRTGVDVLKALCLGADAVLIGRPFVYGLSIGGKRGARDALRALLADVDQSMGLSGIASVADCNKDMVRFVQYPGDGKASN